MVAFRTFDALINKANGEADLLKRIEKLKESEELAGDDFAIIPTVFKPQRHLVSPRVEGWQ